MINLQELKEQIERVIDMENMPMVKMTNREMVEFKKKYGDADVVIGDYAIKKVHNRDDE